MHVKVCGITRAEDAQLAAALGAAAIGFVFWPSSPRCVTPEAARAIVAELPPFVVPVGVFVDQPVREILDAVAGAGLGAVQLHGREPSATCDRVGPRVIKSVSVRDGRPTLDIDAYPGAVTILLDAHDPVRRGGTGRTVDWGVAARVAASRRTILSGGLTASNVAEAIARVRPHAIDVSSGVEDAPGRKNAGKLTAFFAAVERARLSMTEPTT
jgi:phosphoribosylanthranilate isomerase